MFSPLFPKWLKVSQVWCICKDQFLGFAKRLIIFRNSHSKMNNFISKPFHFNFLTLVVHLALLSCSKVNLHARIVSSIFPSILTSCSVHVEVMQHNAAGTMFHFRDSLLRKMWSKIFLRLFCHSSIFDRFLEFRTNKFNLKSLRFLGHFAAFYGYFYFPVCQCWRLSVLSQSFQFPERTALRNIQRLGNCFKNQFFFETFTEESISWMTFCI